MFEEMIAENFLNVLKDIPTDSKAGWTPNKTNSKKFMSTCIMVKLLETKD